MIRAVSSSILPSQGAKQINGIKHGIGECEMAIRSSWISTLSSSSLAEKSNGHDPLAESNCELAAKLSHATGCYEIAAQYLPLVA